MSLKDKISERQKTGLDARRELKIGKTKITATINNKMELKDVIKKVLVKKSKGNFQKSRRICCRSCRV